jgi:hypothetical protein
MRLKGSGLRVARGKLAELLDSNEGLSIGSGTSSMGVVTIIVIGMLLELWKTVANILCLGFVGRGFCT